VKAGGGPGSAAAPCPGAGLRGVLRRGWAILRVAVQHRVAYGAELLVRPLFLLPILFIFRQLYARVLPGGEGLAGYDGAGVLWYLVLTESILTAAPRIGPQVPRRLANCRQPRASRSATDADSAAAEPATGSLVIV